MKALRNDSTLPRLVRLPRCLWNRCDVCGKIIPFADLDSGKAVRMIETVDSCYTNEDYTTLCRNHYKPNDTALQPAPAGTQKPLVGTRPLHPNPDPDHAWWCPTCDRWVQNEHVTFEETHDPRNGGCGGKVE